VIDRSRDPAERAQMARMCMVSFDAFYLNYWPRLVRFLKTQAYNSRFAEDVAIQAMMAAADSWDDLLTYDRPDCWLFKVAVRMLRRLEAGARRDGWLCESPETFAEDLRMEALRDDWVEDYVDLIAAVRSLPRRQCEVIGLHYLCDYTIAETARMLGTPVGTVKAHLHGGLEALRAYFGVPARRKTPRRIPA
jgi:RNA polymerase sigma-70 factor (ECF subfamily)